MNHKTYSASSISALQKRLYHQAIREYFPCFFRQAFSSLNPSDNYLHNWHIDAIYEYLQALEREEISRLIINMPPRSLKSLSVTVAWTSFLLGNNPAAKIITASYSSAISIKHSLDVRALLSQSWFKKTFPALILQQGQNEKHKFVTTRHGFRLATSIGGSLTGEGGDIIIVDDPLNPMQAASSYYRNRANQWFDSTLSSRLNHKTKGRMLVVMQRLHQEDLTGHLLQKGGWEHLSLPAIAQEKTVFSFGNFFKQMERGELLQPVHEPLSVLQKLQKDLGSMAFSAQYLQNPVSEEGHLVKKEWLHIIEQLPDEFDMVIQSWDTALKSADYHDKSACVTIGAKNGIFYILDITILQSEYPELRKAIINLGERRKPDAILIEDKASGQSLCQDLRLSGNLPVIPVLPKGNKLQRLTQITPLLEAGKIIFPSYAVWYDNFIMELLNFPYGKHDDQVDAFSQGINWLQLRHRQGYQSIRII